MAKPISAVRLEREVTALKQRVSWLEKALRPKPAKARLRDGKAHDARTGAERDARHQATLAYYEQKRREHYRANPDLLKVERKRERELNDYLRERGLRPGPSGLPSGLGKPKTHAKSGQRGI